MNRRRVYAALIVLAALLVWIASTYDASRRAASTTSTDATTDADLGADARASRPDRGDRTHIAPTPTHSVVDTAADAGTDSTRRIHGKVTSWSDTAKEDVTGALVEAITLKTPLGDFDEFDPHELRDVPVTLVEPPVATAVLNADGDYTLEIPVRGRIAIRASLKGYATEVVDAGTASEAPDIRLERMRPAVVRVVDRAGLPVAGALVTPDSYSDSLNFLTDSVTTDRDGRCVVHAAQAGAGGWTIRAGGHGFMLLHKLVQGRETLVVLPPGRTDGIWGRVVDAQGRGIPGAVVAGVQQRVVVTDDDGNFALEGLCAPAHGSLTAYSQGLSARDSESVRTGQRDVTIVMYGAATVTGHVLDEEDRPIGGAHVATDGNASTITAEDGTFTMKDLRAGPVQLTAEVTRRFAPFEEPLPMARDTKSIDLDDGAMSDVVLRPRTAPLSFVHLRVVDERGADIEVCGIDFDKRPIASLDVANGSKLAAFDVVPGTTLSVEITRTSPRSTGHAEVVTTSAPAVEPERVVPRAPPQSVRIRLVVSPPAGVDLHASKGSGFEAQASTATDWFFFERDPEDPLRASAWVPPHTPIDVTVNAAGCVATKERMVSPESGDIELRVQLERGARVTGRVLIRGGRPWPDVTVALEPAATAGFGQTLVEQTDCKTDADGRFAFAGVAPGDRFVRVGNFLWELAARRRVTVRAGETIDVGDIVAFDDPAIRGVLRDERGRPAGGVSAWLVSREGLDSVLTWATGSDGSFESTVPAEGEFWLDFRRRDGARLLVPVPPVAPASGKRPELELVIGPPSAIDLGLANDDTHVARFRVELKYGTRIESWWSPRSGNEAVALTFKVPPGRVVVRVYTDALEAGPCWEGEFDVKPGDTVRGEVPRVR